MGAADVKEEAEHVGPHPSLPLIEGHYHRSYFVLATTSLTGDRHTGGICALLASLDFETEVERR